ncbi:acyl-CoA carboxylase subunit epsilon [Streptomyces sp. Je 1-79]|uniref:acyl-CoA carboxylase epsilon subunit n=1 Tax=Streptomyces sp. Je 1-79 TaxID=2943847 RepID=UPI0021A65D21|nr:acyl-CoA carboxylase epsilon subunit [Streptomyces sp. Je 1-79]MCT4356442.1 acyl-CoA carboxylase subunit epsilon [Streptomyces sp. Je 1-79]
MSADPGDEARTGGAPAGRSEDQALVIKVVKGRAEPGELAALTAVLLARAAALGQAVPVPAGPALAGWQRPERVPHHRDPRGRRAPAERR